MQALISGAKTQWISLDTRWDSTPRHKKVPMTHCSVSISVEALLGVQLASRPTTNIKYILWNHCNHLTIPTTHVCKSIRFCVHPINNCHSRVDFLHRIRPILPVTNPVQLGLQSHWQTQKHNWSATRRTQIKTTITKSISSEPFSCHAHFASHTYRVYTLSPKPNSCVFVGIL